MPIRYNLEKAKLEIMRMLAARGLDIFRCSDINSNYHITVNDNRYQTARLRVFGSSLRNMKADKACAP